MSQDGFECSKMSEIQDGALDGLALRRIGFLLAWCRANQAILQTCREELDEIESISRNIFRMPLSPQEASACRAVDIRRIIETGLR